VLPCAAPACSRTIAPARTSPSILWERASTSRPSSCGLANAMASLSKAAGLRGHAPPYRCSMAKRSLFDCGFPLNHRLPPWNPARLEQRIGRVHRLGQAHPVHVVHLLTKDSIEERVWETLRLKKSLFAGVFDSPTGEVSFAALGRKSVLQAVKEIFANQPGRPKPLIDQAPAKSIPIQSLPATPRPLPATATTAAAAASPQSTEFEQAATGLIENGVRFLESLAAVAQNAPADEAFSNLVSVDPRTNRPVLSIPLPKSVDQNRLIRALSAFLGAFGRSA
jgi:hypothetical protein